MLFLLETVEKIDYDQTGCFVIRAGSEEEARKIANEAIVEQNGWNDPPIWEDRAKTSCVPLLGDGPSEIIVQDFNAG